MVVSVLEAGLRPHFSEFGGWAMSDSKRILAIDAGAGTQDILLYESDKTIENCVKMVLPSQTTIVAGRVRQATARGEDVFL